MAAIPATRVSAGPHAHLFTWTLTTGDTAVPVQIPGAADKTVQVTGTFGSGTVTMVGSNDGTNYVTLNDVSGTAIALTSAGMKVVLENPWYMGVTLTGSTGATVVITMCARITE